MRHPVLMICKVEGFILKRQREICVPQSVHFYGGIDSDDSENRLVPAELQAIRPEPTDVTLRPVSR